MFCLTFKHVTPIAGIPRGIWTLLMESNDPQAIGKLILYCELLSYYSVRPYVLVDGGRVSEIVHQRFFQF